MATTTVRIGMLGCGVVGGALADLLQERGADIEARFGIRFTIGPVAVRDLAKTRPPSIDPGVFTTDADAVVDSDDVDIVVELMGGVEPAGTLLTRALMSGKPVVTGNKALLATAGADLFAAADAAGVDLLFEAAVAGGIPFIRPLRESLAGEAISRVMGILNGTTNFILSKMSEEGAAYDDVLAEAKRLGYAEEDPTADVGGHDSAAKAAIVASITSGGRVSLDDVHTEGIESITAEDIEHAARLGYVVKLLAIVENVPAGVAVRVHPMMLPDTHPLAAVRDSFNAVFVEGASVGELMFYGRGAGGGPTASAVLGDLIDAATNLRKRTHASLLTPDPASMVPLSDMSSAFYCNLHLADRPGVLARVAGVLADHGISIRSLEQIGIGDQAQVAIITHVAAESAMAETLAELSVLDDVHAVQSVIRVLT